MMLHLLLLLKSIDLGHFFHGNINYCSWQLSLLPTFFVDLKFIKYLSLLRNASPKDIILIFFIYYNASAIEVTLTLFLLSERFHIMIRLLEKYINTY